MFFSTIGSTVLVYIGDVDAAHFSAPLDQRQDGVLMGIAALGPATALFGADERLVNLDNARASSAAQWGCEIARAHGLADAVGHEPCRAQRDLECAVKLVCRDTLLAGCEQVEGLQPLVHGNVAVLEDRTDFDREGLAADVALVDADPRGLATHFAYAVALAALWAHGAVRPNMGLNPFVGRFLVVEMIVGNNGHWNLH